MRRVILAPVLKFFFDSPTHFDAIFGRYGNVATVKQRVHVLSEKDPVVDCARSIVGVRSYLPCPNTVQSDSRLGELQPGKLVFS
jgi:hypothetical protein